MRIDRREYGETERGKRGTIGVVGESSHLHDGSFQSIDAEYVAGRHFVHGDNLATHKKESIHER